MEVIASVGDAIVVSVIVLFMLSRVEGLEGARIVVALDLRS